MKKKLVMLMMITTVSAFAFAGCGNKEADVVTEDVVVEEAAEEIAEDMEDEAEDEAEEAAEEAEDTVVVENEADAEEEVEVNENEAGDGVSSVNPTLADFNGEYTAEMIESIIPNDHVKMSMEEQGMKMEVCIVRPNVGIFMDMGGTTITMYTSDEYTYLGGVVEGQEVWYKAKGAENLTEGYTEETGDGIKADEIVSISEVRVESRDGIDYNVVDVKTKQVDDFDEEMETEITLYINPTTGYADYMATAVDGTSYEYVISEIDELTLPEGAANAEEMEADALAFAMLGLMMGSLSE